ncbi:uncharacterized protein LOC133290259 [Gastrolobium bilobum]|uniref:uncharacterized protein LOC133290259 n=1 Tax=Gastrolobium bilobum TaxID=150636 RepID=UPI002AB29CBE|nr:uncharacterized protein LOC133290259 [Gastrolobium bilobum]
MIKKDYTNHSRNQVDANLENQTLEDTTSMSSSSEEKEHGSLHYDSDEETSSSYACYDFNGFNKNRVLDYSQNYSTTEIESEDYSTTEIESEDYSQNYYSTNEIEYDDSEDEKFETNLKVPLDPIPEDCETSVFSFDIQNEKNVVHVAVNPVGDSSMEALLWVLNHAVTPSTTVCLVHVYPEIRYISSPLGRMPRNQVNPEYVKFHLTTEQAKKKELLRRFIDKCIDSKVNVEMMLVEGDNVAKTIVDVVWNRCIRKLVIGITNSKLSKSISGTGKGNAIADKVLKNVPDVCDVKIICDRKEVIDQMIGSTSSSPSDSVSGSSKVLKKQDESRGFVPLMRFVANPFGSFRHRVNKL